MFWKAIRWSIVGAALTAPLVVGACLDYHTAEDCNLTSSCPPADAAADADSSMDAGDMGDV